MLTRRRLEVGLGWLWLLDGALQLQPHMFSAQFFGDTLGMGNMGLPAVLSTPYSDITTVLVAHPVVWNTLFATIQLALGVGLLRPRTATIALAASIPWAFAVWAFGEGFGGLFMGNSVIIGAPGPALLYVVAALLLWPGRRERATIGESGLLGATGANLAWFALWAGIALMEIRRANHAAGVPGAQLHNIAEGEPGPIAAVNHAVGNAAGHQGLILAAVIAGAALLAAAGVLHLATRRVALGIGMAVGVVAGIFGQDLGGILTGRGTDPGSGPLFVLIALALWPRRVVERRAESPHVTLAMVVADEPTLQPARASHGAPRS
jgi:hypothetical protein